MKGKEKRALRAQANMLKAEVWVGKEAVSPGVATNLDNALRTKELVKVKVLRSCPIPKEDVARILAQKVGAEVVQILGNTILFYRPLPEEGEKN